MGGGGEERKKDGREFEGWVLLAKQALNKELIAVLRSTKKKREEREKQIFTDKEEYSVF
jgi:hypothetical protein